MASYMDGGYCYVCGADVHHDALRECARCLSMACGECRGIDDGEAVCAECAADAAADEADDGVLAVVLGEEMT